MHAATDTTTGELVYAALVEPSRWEADCRRTRRLADGSVRFACPACRRPVIGCSSADAFARTAVHFKHLRGTACPYDGRPNESALHARLKLEVARLVRAHGWTATCESPGEDWRADVLASADLVDVVVDGRAFNADVVYASSARRRIAFEVQVSAQTASTTNERTARYHATATDVVWLLAWTGVDAGAHPFAVAVTDDPFHVVCGLSDRREVGGWRPRRTPTPLSAFVAAVLAGDIANRRVAGTGRRFEWVALADVERENRYAARVERIIAERAELTARLCDELVAIGVRPNVSADSWADGYASVVRWVDPLDGRGRSVAVLPRQLARAACALAGHDAVVDAPGASVAELVRRLTAPRSPAPPPVTPPVGMPTSLVQHAPRAGAPAARTPGRRDRRHRIGWRWLRSLLGGLR